MVEPKRYQKKKRIYTRWDKQTEEVRILSEKKIPIPRRFTDEIPGLTIEEKEVISNYAQEIAIHSREGEFVLDFLSPARENKMKVICRLLLSPRLVKKMIRILEAR